ncbi:MAG: HAMP domain-containing histidine kinase [Ruminococcaceae bacterium]|nr:HAMP domain-containing histidine kinase [Oscillospiraceae bacterium]
MKKTYLKITILICTLILVVMVLGCALFTYFQVDRINSQYIEDIYKAAKSSPSEFEEGSTGRYESSIEQYYANKFFRSTYAHEVGFYGKITWKWTTSEFTHDIESIDFKRSSVYLVNSNSEKGTIHFVIGDDTLGNATYYLNDRTGVGVSIIAPAPGTDSGWQIDLKYASEEYTGPVNSSEKTVKLDQEAKQIYEELSGDALLKRIDEVKTGWFTSYVALFNEHTMNNNIIQINECDVLVFHPFQMVFAKYGYVYLLFLLVLIVLLFIAVFSMRRMYKNRVQFEARTKSLTRSFAHELKTPLAVTKAYVENWDLVDENDRPDVSAKINSEVDHMTKMVNTLLDLSNIDSGDVSLNLEEVELYDLSMSCYKHLEKIAKEKEVDVVFTKDKEDGKYLVSADLNMMQMVISNFISNAIKYGKKKIGISLLCENNNVTFKITNDGDPISKKDQKKIWDLFYKKDKSGTDRLNSNGIGLAVNKSILELHKAKFGVTSNDTGTTFWFEMKKVK